MIYPAAAATLPFTRPVTVLLIVLVAIAHSRGRFGPSNRTRSAKLLFNFIYTLALFLYSPWRVSPLSLLFLSLLLSLTHTHTLVGVINSTTVVSKGQLLRAMCGHIATAQADVFIARCVPACVCGCCAWGGVEVFFFCCLFIYQQGIH